jgi:polar amino acid transport system substrate-binding protein
MDRNGIVACYFLYYTAFVYGQHTLKFTVEQERPMIKTRVIPILLGTILVVLVGILVSGPAQLSPASEIASIRPSDKLAQILDRGTLVIPTDLAYPLQSDLLEGARRTGGTRCTPDQYTVGELGGFDIEVAVEIAGRLGVEACFVGAAWEAVTAGNWPEQWDISIGSMAITARRTEILYFTQPYYATPAIFFIHQDNTTYTRPADLSGQNIGVCRGCTYQAYLEGSLAIPGQSIDFVVDRPAIIPYETDTMAIHDLTVGDGLQLNAVLTAQSTGQAWTAVGQPLKPLGRPVFIEYLAAAVDRDGSPNPLPLVRQVSQIIQEMHQDGTLRHLSQKYYGEDLTAAAAQFNLETLGQFR